MSAESLAAIMASSTTAIAAAYQPPPCSSGKANTLANPPRNSIVTSSNLGRPLLYLDEVCSSSPPPPPPPTKRTRAPRAIRKSAYTAELKKEVRGAASGASGRIPDLMAMDKFLDSPLAVSRFNPAQFLDDFVFDNAPSFKLPEDREDRADRHWPPQSVDTSLETSPSSSVSAISPIGCSPFWPPPSADRSGSVWSPPVMPLDRSSPLESPLVDMFEKMRPFSFY